MLSLPRGLVVAWFVGCPAIGVAAPLSVDAVVAGALANDPRAVASEAAIEAAEARRREAAVFLANPEAEFGVGLIGGKIEGSLTQPLSLGGEGWYARSAASAGIDAATAEGWRGRLATAAGARVVLAEAIAAEQRATVTAEALEQARRWRTSVEARTAAGEAGVLDARVARLAEAEAVAAAIDARRTREAARVALAGLVPEAADAELPSDPVATVPARTGSADRSDLAALDARIRAAEAEVGRARAAAVPTLGLGVFAERETSADAFDVGPTATLELPLWTFGQGDVGQARATVDTLRAERVALAARADAERTRTASTAEWADEAIARLDGVEDDARAALAAIEAAWTSGEMDLLAAFVVRGEVLAGWLASIDAREAHAKAALDALLAHEDPALIPGEVTP